VVYIGLDDTDRAGVPGTGRLARALAEYLADEHAVWGVTRHQLLVHPAVPYTKNNSANVVILADGAGDLPKLVGRATEYVVPRCAAGSDPALCVATADQVHDVTYGQRCQTEVVSVALANATAESLEIYLRSLGGSPCGVIGALAGVCLAAGGNDGRFVHVGRVRGLVGSVPVDEVIEAGVDCVVTRDGEPVTRGSVRTGDKLRPALRDGRPVLYVQPSGQDTWQALKV